MAPPETTFPLHELENRVHIKPVDSKEKSRKLPTNFDLKRDCELLELVQYKCTTAEELENKALNDPEGPGQMECFPFVRLFRRCGEGEKMFHVETTAWEGRLAYKYSKKVLDEIQSKSTTSVTRKQGQAEETGKTTSTVNNNSNQFASYGSYFWSAE